MKRTFLRFILMPLLMWGSLVPLMSSAEARAPRILKFQGVPVNLASGLRKKFPFVFEREVTLTEVDEIVRHLMKTGGFSNIEVVERDVESANERELVLVASVLRKVKDVRIRGNRVIGDSEVLRLLGTGAGQPFERKNLVAASEELRRTYERMGYHGARVEIEFEVPNDSEVVVIANIAEGTPVKVQELIIDSPNAELSARLVRLGRYLKGRILTDDELLEYHKRVLEYFRDNRYLTARLTAPAIATNADKTQAKVTYGIENPWRFEFRFTGNGYLSDGTIIRQLESEKLSGATSSPAPDMAERVRRMYEAAGFANIEVEFTEDRNETAFRHLISFKVTENPRVRIKKIEITGNVSRPEAYYTKFISISSSDLIGEGFYNRRDIEEGAKRLIIELQNQGYLRAKIQSQRAEFSKDRTNVVITFNLDEGPLTQVRQIRFEGVEAFPRQQLLNLMKIKTGAALSLSELEQSRQALKEFYQSEGFLEMTIRNENERNSIVTYNDSNTQANVEFNIYEGPRILVREVSIRGNSFTKEHVIRRELAFTPGDVLTPDRIIDSQSRLQSLGLFSRVLIRTSDENSTVAERSVIVEVTEADPGVFKLGFGVNNERDLTFRGYAAVAYSNLYGTGRGLSFRVDPKYSTDKRIGFLQNRETLSYIEPYIFNDRNRGRINIIRDQSFFAFAKDANDIENQALIMEENSVGFLLERDLTRHTKLTYTAYNFANQLEFNLQTNAIVKTQNIAKTGPFLEFDYRNDPFQPSRGTYSFINLEYSDPLLGSSRDATQTINFVKTNASISGYQKLFNINDLVWANSVRAGYVANISSDRYAGVPSQESFFLGGRTTIRGFDSSDQFPNRYDLERNDPRIVDLSKFTVTSDSYFYLGKTELRFPLYKNFFLGPLGGTIFYDGGAVILSQLTLPETYRDAAGIGLRVATPVGPLNLEIGWKLDRRLLRSAEDGKAEVREAPWAFHFSIGSF